MKIVTIIASTSLLLMSAVSFAQSQPMTPAKSATPTGEMNRSEVNTSEKLAADKQKTSSEHYSKLDTNKDGKLSSAEFSAMSEAGSDFETLDSDKDGNLTTMEFSKRKMQ